MILGQFNPTTLSMLWISSFNSFYVCEFASNVSVFFFFMKIRFLKTICEKNLHIYLILCIHIMSVYLHFYT